MKKPGANKPSEATLYSAPQRCRWGYKMKKKVGCIVGLVTLVAVAVFVLLPALTMPRPSSIVMVDMANLNQIGRACWRYAFDHDGQFPPDFSHLTQYADHPRLYVSRHDRDQAGSLSNVMDWTSYVYLSGNTTSSPPDTVVAFLPPGHYEKRNGGVILFADGSVEWKKLQEFTKTLNQTPTKKSTVPTVARERAPAVP